MVEQVGGVVGVVDGGVAVPGRRRRYASQRRESVVKVRYGEGELAEVVRAAALVGLRPAGFVASAALLVAAGLARDAGVGCGDGSRCGQEPVVVTDDGQGEAGVLGRHLVQVSWAGGEHREVLAELIAGRLALRRYGVNVNQAVAVLHRDGQAPDWLRQAVEGADRAVARVDAATVQLTRRLS